MKRGKKKRYELESCDAACRAGKLEVEKKKDWVKAGERTESLLEVSKGPGSKIRKEQVCVCNCPM